VILETANLILRMAGEEHFESCAGNVEKLDNRASGKINYPSLRVYKDGFNSAKVVNFIASTNV
jgi:hypothetical protein